MSTMTVKEPVKVVVAEMRNFADVADRCELTAGNAAAAIRAWADQLEAAAPQPPAEAQAQGDRMAIKMLVAAGHVTEAKANEALNIAHGFDKGPLAQAQGGGEVDPLYRLFRAIVDAGGPETIARHGVERGSGDWAQEVRAGLLSIERRFHPDRFDGLPTPPSAPVGVEDMQDDWPTPDLLAEAERIAANQHKDGRYAAARVLRILCHRLAQQPSIAPVGVEGDLPNRLLLEAAALCLIKGRTDQSSDVALLREAAAALAQQPAPSAPVGVEGLVKDMRMVSRLAPRVKSDCVSRWADRLEALAQQPAAVDETIRSLPALWRQREPDNGEAYTDYDRGYDQASDECADALEQALAQPQGAAS